MIITTHDPKSIAAAMSLLLAAAPCAAADFFLKNGDTVSMIGDSITEQHLYSTYVEAWTLTRFPAWDVKFFNVGIGGDNATWGGERFKRDVLSCGVTAMTVNFGMNDCGGPSSKFDEPRYNEFKYAMQKLADQIKSGQYAISMGCTKVATNSAAELGQGVNLASAVLAAGPIADQVKAVAAAINAKNSYFHDRIFCEVLRAGNVPAFMEITTEQVEAKRMSVFNERMKKMPELFDAIRKTLILKAHAVEIVPVTKVN